MKHIAAQTILPVAYMVYDYQFVLKRDYLSHAPHGDMRHGKVLYPERINHSADAYNGGNGPTWIWGGTGAPMAPETGVFSRGSWFWDNYFWSGSVSPTQEWAPLSFWSTCPDKSRTTL